MKSVLISIQPKWVEKIASGEKTIEVRKSVPKLEIPFKCYIYCTQTKTIGDIILCKSEENAKLFGYNTIKGINKGFAKKEDIKLKGKVIGEFVCRGMMGGGSKLLPKQSCLTINEILDYGKGKKVYGWRIADLKIYDKPKELSEFCTVKEIGGYEEFKRIARPPQSWCYVEVE